MRKVVVLIAVVLGAVCVVSATESFWGLINTDGVHIRADATVGAVSICQAGEGQVVEVVDSAYDWYKIALPEQAPVFVSGKFIKMNEDNQWQISGNNVNLRMKPDIGAPILGQVDKGTRIQVIKQEGEWYRIKPTVETTGWINRRFVDQTDAPVKGEPQSVKKTVVSQKQETRVPKTEQAEVQADRPVIAVQGMLRSKFFTTVASHKLITDQKEVYLIRSSAVYLDDYVNERVRVTGLVSEIQEAADPLIEVQEITREIND